jgi:hypothetical protein
VKWLDLNDLEGAIKKIRAVCEEFPDSSDFWFLLSSQLRRQGDHEVG